MEKLKIDEKLFMDPELEQTTRELYNAFVNDSELYKETREAGFSDQEIYDNIGTFSDLQNHRNIEKLVKTFNDCKKYNCYYHVSIVKKDYGLEKVYDAIEPYKKHLIYNARFLFKDFPDNSNDATWSKIKNAPIKKTIKDKLKSEKWIYLTGAIGSGRTYISIALTNAKIAKNNSKVAFIDAVKRFAELGRIYFSDNLDFRHVMEELTNVELLVIDNFGSEYKNTIIRDAILIPLLEQRASLNKTTVFTSNHDINRIQKMYELKKDAGDKVSAETLGNILRDKCGKEIKVCSEPLY